MEAGGLALNAEGTVLEFGDFDLGAIGACFRTIRTAAFGTNKEFVWAFS
jgi:hypothetical protein